MSFKISDTRKGGWVNFSTIRSGDCFENKNGDIYRKCNDGSLALSITNLIGITEFLPTTKVKPVSIIITVK